MIRQDSNCSCHFSLSRAASHFSRVSLYFSSAPHLLPLSLSASVSPITPKFCQTIQKSYKLMEICKNTIIICPRKWYFIISDLRPSRQKKYGQSARSNARESVGGQIREPGTPPEHVTGLTRQFAENNSFLFMLILELTLLSLFHSKNPEDRMCA